MSAKIDNLGRLIHDSGFVLGIRYNGTDTYIPAILAQSGVAVSVTGTLAETTLASVTIPGGLMGPNGSLRITLLWSNTNNANAKTVQVKIDGQIVSSANQANNASYQHLVIVHNRGSQSAQVMMRSSQVGGLAQNSTGTTVTAIDTSIDKVITFTGTLGVAGDTITLEGYTVEILPSA
jgi:hypothetical protein